MRKYVRLAVIVGLGGALVIVAIKFAVAFPVREETWIAGTPTGVGWSEADGIPRHLGIDNRTEVLTDAAVDPDSAGPKEADRYWAAHANGSGTTVVRFRTRGFREVDAVLMRRSLTSIFGTRVLEWSCRLKGVVSADGSEYDLSPLFTGGGVDGYSVQAASRFDEKSRTLTMEIVEQTLYGAAARCTFRFRLREDLGVDYLGS
jgi:hypothetical protein